MTEPKNKAGVPMPIPMCDDWGDSLVVTTLPCECSQPKPIDTLDLTAYTKTATEIGDKINEVIDRLNELTQNIGD